MRLSSAVAPPQISQNVDSAVKVKDAAAEGFQALLCLFSTLGLLNVLFQCPLSLSLRRESLAACRAFFKFWIECFPPEPMKSSAARRPVVPR